MTGRQEGRQEGKDQGKKPLARSTESLGWLAQSGMQPRKRRDIEGDRFTAEHIWECCRASGLPVTLTATLQTTPVRFFTIYTPGTFFLRPAEALAQPTPTMMTSATPHSPLPPAMTSATPCRRGCLQPGCDAGAGVEGAAGGCVGEGGEA